MSRSFGLALSILAAVSGAVPVAAATNFTATLDGLQETTINGGTATGTGDATLSDDGNIFSATLSWSGLSAPASAGFVQCCAPIGDDGPAALDLAVSSAVTGSVSRTFDLTALSTYTSDFLAANGGTVIAARSRFLDGLMMGNAYFNLLDTNFTDGGIRGQLNTSDGGAGGGGGGSGGTGAVPEPSSWSLLIAGFATAGIAGRRARSHTRAQA